MKLHEFLITHPKVRKMNKEEQQKALAEYNRQTGGEHKDMRKQVVKRSKERTTKVRKNMQNPRDHVKQQLRASKYLNALLNPFHSPVARFPDLECNSTVTFQVKQSYKLVADTNGRACIFIRPGLSKVIAISGARSDLSIKWGDDAGTALTITDARIPSMVWDAALGIAGYGLGTNYREQVMPPAWSEGSFSVFDLKDLNKTDQLRNLYDKSRVTACGVSLRYVGAPLNAKGRLVAVPWKGSYGAPGWGNYSLAIGDSRDGVGLPAPKDGPNYENLLTLEGAVEAAAIDGITEHWVPTGIEAASDFRATRYTPPYQNQYARGAWANSLTPNSTTQPQITFPAAVCNNDEYAAFADALTRFNPSVTASNSGGVTNALFGNGPWSSSVGASGSPGTPSEYADTSLYGFGKLLASTTAGTNNASNNVLIVKRSMEQVANGFLTSAMSPGDQGICIIAEGLVPSTKKDTPVPGVFAIDQESDCYEVEVVINYEATVDQRTISVGGMFTPPVALIANHVAGRNAVAAAQVMPVAHVGPHNTDSAAKNIGKWIDDASSTITSMWTTGKSIYGSIEKGFNGLFGDGAFSDVVDGALDAGLALFA
jgi:hypothetical protein